jgi:hypothetical protein
VIPRSVATTTVANIRATRGWEVERSGADGDPGHLPPGVTAVRRFLFAGRIWTAIPTRVVKDTAERLVVAHWPSTVAKVPTSYLRAARSDDEAWRFRLLEDLGAGDWQLTDWSWTRTTMLTVMIPDEWFSVALMFSGDGHDFLCWYVNFEEPFRRTPIGTDSSDLALDLVVDPDGTWRWKDEDEYEHARRLGVITARQHDAVETARERAVDLIGRQSGPLSERWTRWRRDEGWPAPSLPDGWDDLDPSSS